MRTLGITSHTTGTVLCANLRDHYTVVQFDVDEAGGACSGTALEIPRIRGANNGDRVVLEYIVSLSSGLWYGRIPQPGEIDGKPNLGRTAQNESGRVSGPAESSGPAGDSGSKCQSYWPRGD